MAGTIKNNFNIELLQASNYHTWKFRIKTLLEEYDVACCIENEYNESVYEDDKKKMEARKRENKCKSLLVQCIDDTQIDLIQDKQTAYSMWNALKERYEKKGIPGQIMLRKRLMSLKVKEDDDLEDFIKQFDDIIRQLKVTGADISEKDQIYTILLALPQSYETVVTILENLPDNELTLDVVKTKLRSEVDRRKASCNKIGRNDSKPTAFFVNPMIKCYFCGEKGHLKRHCSKFLEMVSNRRGNSSYQPINRFKHQMPNRGNYKTRGNGGRNQIRSNSSNRGRESNIVTRNQEDESEEKSICFMADTHKHSELDTVSDNITFIIDSGCTDHLVNNKNYFIDLLMLEEPINIVVAKSNNFMQAVGVGNIKIFSLVNGKKIECIIKNVFYVPTLRKNLLSVKRLEMADIKVLFDNGQVKLFLEHELIGIGNRNNLYEIKFKLIYPESLNIETENENLKLWHKRYGHICNENMKKLIKNNAVDGLSNLKISSRVEFCEACVSGKSTRKRFGIRNKAKRLLEIIHSDVAGPITPTAHDGGKYFVSFIDDYSNFVYVYIIKTKSEVFDCFREYCNMIQSKFNLKISTLRCDNGGEYSSQEFKKFCKENGTFIDYTTPYTPEQNGKAERFNRSVVEKARAMLQQANMPKKFWNEAIRVAAYIINRSLSPNFEEKTPVEIWSGRKPNVSNLRVFGCMGYAHIPHQFRNKFDEKTEECLMMGYAPTGYRIWDIKTQKIKIARDVVFNEDEFYFRKTKITVDKTESNDSLELMDNIEQTEEEIEAEEIVEMEETEKMEQNLKRESRRAKKLPERYGDFEMYMAFDAVSYVEDVPESYENLNGREDEIYWKNAMKEEIKSIEKNETWIEVEKPKNSEILNTKWIFSFKPLELNIEHKYKARLVVRGFAQCKTFDYNVIYSPVAKLSTIRTLLSIGNQLGYYFIQLDVKTAFLHGELKENIYIYPPIGVECKEGYVLKLLKSIYGLKQAAKCWNIKINNFLEGLGFVRSESDYCLYTKLVSDHIMYLLLYVDDMIIAGKDLKLIEKCKGDLMSKFEMKDKKYLKNFLGLEIDYDRDLGILKISQKYYLLGILKRFGFENCKKCTLPIDPNLKLNLNKENEIQVPIRELIGCLMYLMLGSRPDISFSINLFSRFQDRNLWEVWTGLKRLLRYLKGTVDVSLNYKRNNKALTMTCYVDSDWGADSFDRKSISGFLIRVFDNTVLWTTRKQNSIALSSTEAELIALCTAVKECLWLKRVTSDLGIFLKDFTIYEDNQGCISIINNPENNVRVKHIDLKYKFVSEYVRNKTIIIEYVGTNYQLADFLTKGLHRIRFYENCKNIGLEFREG